MSISGKNESLTALGIQFRVLAHAFPVLRHDAIKPISNAKLAAAMMQKSSSSGEEYGDDRTQQLLIDLDFMLDEGVDTVRLLADWLYDSGKRIDVESLLSTCTKLMFTHLLLSGKKVTLLASAGQPEVALYSGRYVLLGWLLHMVETMADGDELRIAFVDGSRMVASLVAGGGSKPLRPSDLAAEPIMPYEWAAELAHAYGWEMHRQPGGWALQWPGAVQTRHMAA